MEKKEAQNRDSELRVSTERNKQLNRVMNMEYYSPLWVDPDLIPLGMEYRWIRESVLGQPDLSRSIEMRRAGWTPVPASRHPDMCFDDFLGRQTHLKGFIFHKGLVLFERERKIGDAEKEYWAELNRKRVTSLPGRETELGEPIIPLGNNAITFGLSDKGFK
jgi:hypothetical protein